MKFSKIAKFLKIKDSILFDKLHEALLSLKNNTEYSEIVITLHNSKNIEINNGEFKNNFSIKIEFGFYIRLIYHKNIYFFYKSITTLDDIINYINNIIEIINSNLNLQKNFIEFDFKNYLINTKEQIHKPEIKIDLEEKSLNYRIEHLKKMSEIKSDFAHIIENINLQYYESEFSTLFINSIGNLFETYIPMFEFYFNINLLGLDESSRLFSKQYAYCGGLEVFDIIQEQNYVNEIYQKIKDIHIAEYLPTSISYDYLAFTYDVLGLILHESFGHACEGDYIISNSSDLFNKKDELTINKNINISINPQLKNCGFTPVDFEGVQGEKKDIIRDGKFIDFINNRETSYISNSRPSGSMKTNIYRKPPLVRMTSIYLDTTLKLYDFNNEHITLDKIKDVLIKNDILDETSSVLLADGWIGGTGQWVSLNFDIDIMTLYLFRKDEETKIYYNANLKGNTLSFLNSFIGSIYPLKVDTIGQCWKYDSAILTSDGGPYVTLFKQNESIKISGGYK